MLVRIFGPIDEPRWRRVVVRIVWISLAPAVGFSAIGAIVNASRGTFTVQGLVLGIVIFYVIFVIGSVWLAKRVVLPRLKLSQ
jgi:polyferredoxin